jgi:hypothetical protein
MRNAISAPPSVRLMPSQSQPTARSPSSASTIRGRTRPAAHRLPAAVAQQGPGDLQLRPADVVAGQFRPVTLARVAAIALQQQGLRRRQREVVGELWALHLQPEHLAALRSCRYIRQAPIETSQSRLEKLAPRLARAARSAWRRRSPGMVSAAWRRGSGARQAASAALRRFPAGCGRRSAESRCRPVASPARR